MIRRMLACVLSGGLMATGGGCSSAATAIAAPATIATETRFAPQPPPAPREFRAAWVATVGNIDWPSKPGLDADTQKREIDAILDRAQQLRLNALIVQVRPAADALYASNIEPWTHFLTGEQGKNPGYDPLEYWIEHGHARGIEIHAWFNPYRARYNGPRVPFADSHAVKRRPDLVKEYGPYLWMDPGEPDAEQQSFDVFMDVLQRYDVDGIHIDDYFYPYPVKVNPDDENDKREKPFPDDDSWNKFLTAGLRRGATPSREDWRRANINRFVKRIYEGKQKLKPWVKFGISPFGIGRPGTAPGIEGFDQYEKLYADAALWLRNGWCDYFTPQLYWPIAQAKQSYPVLLDYWISENKKRRHIWPGLFTSRVGDGSAKAFSLTEIGDQVFVTRSRDGSTGHVHFSMKTLQRNEALAGGLEKNVYTDAALVPATPWLDSKPPSKPAWKLDASARTLKLTARGEPVRLFAIWQRDPAKGWQFSVLPATNPMLQLADATTEVVITAVDRSGNESGRTRISVIAKK